MLGLHRATGQTLHGVDHIRQSIIDILTTPIGSRVMRRDYGSRLFELLDQPLHRQTVVQIYAATAEALLKWEPRFRLGRVQVEVLDAGSLTLVLEGTLIATQQKLTFSTLTLYSTGNNEG